MDIRDKTAAFLGQLGAKVGPQLGQIGSAVGTAVAGVPGKSQMAQDPWGGHHRQVIPSTQGLLGAIGMPQAAQNVQVQMLNPQVAQAVGAGVVGAGALGLGAAGAVIARGNKKRKERLAGQNLGAQLGVQMPGVI
jgi:hypothetical protein